MARVVRGFFPFISKELMVAGLVGMWETRRERKGGWVIGMLLHTRLHLGTQSRVIQGAVGSSFPRAYQG